MKRTKRKYKPATDQMFLDRLVAGTLLVDTAAATVWSVRDGKAVQLRQYPLGRHANYRSVCCYQDGHRKKVAVHRLVWMAANGRLIPGGYDVDHIDHNTTNNAIDNLQLRPSGNNQHPHTRGEVYSSEGEF